MEWQTGYVRIVIVSFVNSFFLRERMLEYLLLLEYDITRPLNRRVLVQTCYYTYHDPYYDHCCGFFLTGEGDLGSTWVPGSEYRFFALSIPCLAIREDHDEVDGFRLLGIDGQEYQFLPWEEEALAVGPWPENLSIYEKD